MLKNGKSFKKYEIEYEKVGSCNEPTFLVFSPALSVLSVSDTDTGHSRTVSSPFFMKRKTITATSITNPEQNHE